MSTDQHVAIAPARGRSRRVSPAFWLILPSIIFMVFLFAYPMVEGVRAAFVSGDSGAITLDNWRRMISDPLFWPAVRNTVLLIVVIIPLQFLFAMLMALLLQAKPRGSAVYFYLWAIPLAVSDLAAGLVWLSIFADQGYLNSVLVDVGLQPILLAQLPEPADPVRRCDGRRDLAGHLARARHHRVGTPGDPQGL